MHANIHAPSHQIRSRDTSVTDSPEPRLSHGHGETTSLVIKNVFCRSLSLKLEQVALRSENRRQSDSRRCVGYGRCPTELVPGQTCCVKSLVASHANGRLGSQQACSVQGAAYITNGIRRQSGSCKGYDDQGSETTAPIAPTAPVLSEMRSPGPGPAHRR